MRPTYAVVWREPGGDRFAGKLELDETGLRLEGSNPDGSPARVQVAYEDLTGVRIGRSSDERLDGRPCLILEVRSGHPVSLSPVGGTGVVFEIGQVVAELVSERRTPTGPATVIVPIKPGMQSRARALLHRGPPIDLERSPLTRHAVYLTEREAIFVFEGADVEAFAKEFVRSPAAWRAAVAWERCLAGRPRVAEEAYAWKRR